MHKSLLAHYDVGVFYWKSFLQAENKCARGWQQRTKRTGGRVALPSLLVLFDADAAGAQTHDEEQTADHGHGLKEVVLEEVVGLVAGAQVPEVVADHVDDGEHEAQRERTRLGLVANGHEDEQNRADEVDDHVLVLEVDAYEREEHADDEDAADQVDDVLGRAGLGTGASIFIRIVD